MVLQKGFTFENLVGRYKIDNEIIYRLYNEEVRNDKIIKDVTSISEKNAVFLDFISINYEDQRKILDFYDKYGSLGFGKAPRYGESICDVIKEIRIMQLILDIEEHIKNKEISLTLRSLFELNKLISIWYQGVEFLTDGIIYSQDIELMLDKGFYDFDNSSPEFNAMFFFYAKYAVCRMVNSYISEIKPELKLSRDMTYIGNWHSKNLLSSMYFEIFLKLSSNKRFRKCKNSTCSNYFEIIGADTRKIYCNRDCANLEAKRMERTRKRKIEK